MGDMAESEEIDDNELGCLYFAIVGLVGLLGGIVSALFFS
jgi:hypothetical protein